VIHHKASNLVEEQGCHCLKQKLAITQLHANHYLHSATFSTLNMAHHF